MFVSLLLTNCSALVGEMDVEVDRTLEGLEAEPLKPVVY